MSLGAKVNDKDMARMTFLQEPFNILQAISVVAFESRGWESHGN